MSTEVLSIRLYNMEAGAPHLAPWSSAPPAAPGVPPACQAPPSRFQGCMGCCNVQPNAKYPLVSSSLVLRRAVLDSLAPVHKDPPSPPASVLSSIHLHSQPHRPALPSQSWWVARCSALSIAPLLGWSPTPRLPATWLPRHPCGVPPLPARPGVPSPLLWLRRACRRM